MKVRPGRLRQFRHIQSASLCHFGRNLSEDTCFPERYLAFSDLLGNLVAGSGGSLPCDFSLSRDFSGHLVYVIY